MTISLDTATLTDNDAISTASADATIPAQAGGSDLPADPFLLADADRVLLEPSTVNAWPTLAPDARLRILTRARKDAARSQMERERREIRQQRSAAYVSALCSLPKPSEPEYPAAWEDLMAKKAAYYAVKATR
jgi:hypothetical protein